MRDLVSLECSVCKNRNYTTTKNKKKQPKRIEHKKYCATCNKRTVHKETR
ncbi:50S ribosomal protein L33 [candidate division KSB1 bacterium]|nr:50S ribosomal protein L33 [candidate division KSB1 bacterium]